MDRRGNILGEEVLSQRVAFGTRDNKEMIVAPAPLALERHGQFGECLSINTGDFPPPAVPVFELSQLYPQDRGLKLIKTTVVSENVGSVVFTLPIIPNHVRPFGDGPVGGDDHAGVAVSARFLVG